MTTTDKLTLAISLACQAHSGQVDKQGQPYILHPLRVMLAMGLSATEDERIVAVLHDALEDCSETFRSELYSQITSYFSIDVQHALLLLTRSKEETYSSYIERIALDPLAKKVKIADLRDNLNPSRGSAPNLERLKDRYRKALIELGERYYYG